MRTLFFPHYICTPHFETELELISNHIDKGDEVYVVVCRGEMPTCLHNLEHSQSGCIACMANVKRGLKAAKVLPQRIIRLPKDELSYHVVAKRFPNISELKKFYIDCIDIGAAAASTLVFTHRKEPLLDTVKFSADVYRELKLGWYIYNTFLELIQKIKPDRVYLFNGRFTVPRMMMRVCEKLHIDFYTHDRAGVLKRYDLRKNALPHDTDYSTREILSLWDSARDDRVAIASQWYIDRRKGADQSFHSFTKHQTTGSLPSNFDKSKENIAIYNSSLEEVAGIPGWDISKYDYGLGGLRKILKNFEDNNKYHFYFRVHPSLRKCNNSQTRDIELLQTDFKNLTIIPPESKLHSYALLDNCTKVIVFASTVGVEATFWGKPSILLAKAMYENLDCCYKPSSIEDAIQLIQNKLEPKPRIGALKYAYWNAIYGVPFKKFEQTSVIQGQFLGKTICRMNLQVMVVYYFIQVLKSKSLSQVVQFVNHSFIPWIKKKCSLAFSSALRR